MTQNKRKLIVVLVALVMAFVLSLAHALTEGFVEIATVGVVAFAGANMAEHWAKRGSV